MKPAALIRLLLAVALLTAAAGAPLSAIAAAPVPELTTLAAYYPPDTDVFFGLRLDDAYLATLDDLLTRIVQRLPKGLNLRDVTLHNLLNAIAAESIPGSTFAEDIRPWLGDYAAFGITTVMPETATDPDRSVQANAQKSVIVLSVADRAAAQAYLSGIVSPRRIVRQMGDYTIFYTTAADSATLFLYEDALIICQQVGNVVRNAEAPNLGANPDFLNALAGLPAEAYDGLLYATGEALAIYETAALDPATFDLAMLTATLSDAALAAGLTFQDGAIQMDSVSYGVSTARANMRPVDPAFLGYVPANAQFVQHRTGLNTLPAGLVKEDREMIHSFFDEFFGINFEQDLTSWMTGDYALHISFEPAFFPLLFDNVFPDDLNALPFDFGLVVEATDPDAAQTVFETLYDELYWYVLILNEAYREEGIQISLDKETLGTGEAMVLAIRDSKESGLSFPIEVLLGVNDAVFVLGTRPAVTTALTAPNFLQTGGVLAARLPDNTAFQAARADLPADVTTMTYVSPDGLASLGDILTWALAWAPLLDDPSAVFGDAKPADAYTAQWTVDMTAREAAHLYQPMFDNIMDLFDHMLSYEVMPADGQSVVRVTLALDS